MGRVKIIPGSDLANELAGLQWDLSRDSKLILERTGRLREDPACPNHLCDALLYLYRYSYHFWARPTDLGPERDTPAWWTEYHKAEVEKAVRRRQLGRQDPHGLYAYAAGDKRTYDA